MCQLATQPLFDLLKSTTLVSTADNQIFSSSSSYAELEREYKLLGPCIPPSLPLWLFPPLACYGRTWVASDTVTLTDTCQPSHPTCLVG